MAEFKPGDTIRSLRRFAKDTDEGPTLTGEVLAQEHLSDEFYRIKVTSAEHRGQVRHVYRRGAQLVERAGEWDLDHPPNDLTLVVAQATPGNGSFGLQRHLHRGQDGSWTLGDRVEKNVWSTARTWRSALDTWFRPGSTFKTEVREAPDLMTRIRGLEVSKVGGIEVGKLVEGRLRTSTGRITGVLLGQYGDRDNNRAMVRENSTGLNRVVVASSLRELGLPEFKLGDVVYGKIRGGRATYTGTITQVGKFGLTAEDEYLIEPSGPGSGKYILKEGAGLVRKGTDGPLAEWEKELLTSSTAPAPAPGLFSGPEAEDIINNPSHYTSTVPGIECKDVAGWFSFNLGAAIKYIWRAGRKDKDKTVEDLNKARKFLEFEILRLGGEVK